MQGLPGELLMLVMELTNDLNEVFLILNVGTFILKTDLELDFRLRNPARTFVDRFPKSWNMTLLSARIEEARSEPKRFVIVSPVAPYPIDSQSLHLVGFHDGIQFPLTEVLLGLLELGRLAQNLGLRSDPDLLGLSMKPDGVHIYVINQI